MQYEPVSVEERCCIVEYHPRTRSETMQYGHEPEYPMSHHTATGVLMTITTAYLVPRRPDGCLRSQSRDAYGKRGSAGSPHGKRYRATL